MENERPTADIHPAAPGGSLLHCLFLHTALCRSRQTSAAPAVMLPCQTPVGEARKNPSRNSHTPPQRLKPAAWYYVHHYLANHKYNFVHFMEQQKPVGGLYLFVVELNFSNRYTEEKSSNKSE